MGDDTYDAFKMDEDAFFGASPSPRHTTQSSQGGRLRSPTYATGDPPDVSRDSTDSHRERLSHSIRGSIVGYLDENNRPSIYGSAHMDVPPAFVPNPAFDDLPNNDDAGQDVFGDVDDFGALPINSEPGFDFLAPSTVEEIQFPDPVPVPSGPPPDFSAAPTTTTSPPREARKSKSKKASRKRLSGPRAGPSKTSNKRKSADSKSTKTKKKAQPRTTQIFLHGTLIPPPSTMTRTSPSPPRKITSSIPKPAAAAPSIKVERAVHGLGWRGGGDHKPSALALARLKMLAHRKAQSRKESDDSNGEDELDKEAEGDKKEKERIKEMAKKVRAGALRSSIP